tara:strand:+ start:8691 stop:10745 length:2055 start_codon:yes stop_codon:yes gene_type:complete
VRDLNNCDQECFKCIKNYKNKHQLIQGQSFEVNCEGIPDEYIPLHILDDIPEEEKGIALAMVDPVTWAKETLDWHCLDLDGEVWKRKNPDEYYAWLEKNPSESIAGKSRYHRPYQATMLRCSAKRKVFRIGRQAGKTETLVIAMLYALFTKPGIPESEGFKIILITPYQAQIDLIFNRMMQLVRSSSVTANSIRRNVKAPIYTVELHNESIIRGFTAGTKSGGNAEAVRGQHGNMLVFDEADYLSSGDMDAALSIITNYPNATVWMSSTPSGKRERFYQTCSSRIFKEYHYTSQVNPMWNDELEHLFREQLTEIGYDHEILANFGEQEQGVFQNNYIQAAKQRYEYGDLPYKNTWTYTIGVDWNDIGNGTTISVLGFNPAENIFYVVDRAVVSRDGWTQLSACHKIAEYNRLWRPIVIYIDAGFGGTQYEVLRKYGFDSLSDPSKGPTHPDSRLRDIVKKYDFGSKVDVHDLFTKRLTSKPAKPFLIESTVRRFESNDIRFPQSDEKLEAQLQGYIIDRITPTGVPVYKAGDESAGDHALDALMLSVLGFTLEVTPLGKPKYDTGIAFSGKFGQGLDALIHEGDTVVYPGNRKEKLQEEKEGHRPATGRDSIVNKQTSLLGTQGSLPASNTHKGKESVGLWAWQGFGHDAPKPRVRTLGEAEGDARKRTGLRPKLSNKPVRKKI